MTLAVVQVFALVMATWTASATHHGEEFIGVDSSSFRTDGICDDGDDNTCSLGLLQRQAFKTVGESNQTRSTGSRITCLGSVSVGGLGQVKIVATKWDKPGEPAHEVQLANGAVMPHVKGRAYFANSCGESNSYQAVKLLGKKLRYTTDLSHAGCGCNAALYLVQMHKNTELTSCEDFYCDANAVCGASCVEVDVQEANKHAWHTALHSAYDRNGLASGFGGWVHNNNYDFDASKYGPGARCIDTTRPFQVEAAFPASGGIGVTLEQNGCHLHTGIHSYPGMDAITQALAEGVTPVVSYWKSGDMLWMDGPGMGKGPCQSDGQHCGTSAKFYDFSVQ